MFEGTHEVGRSMSEPADVLTLALTGALPFILLSAAVLAWPASLGLLSLYRRAVLRSMRARANAAMASSTAPVRSQKPVRATPEFVFLNSSSSIPLKPTAESLYATFSLAPWRTAATAMHVTVPRERPKPQRTVVSRNFPQPRPGHPSALLVGIKGPVQGKQFSIEKEHYRIGTNSDSDLRITGDEYVSGTHASLRYEHGGFFLYDQDSRNGTFLNEKKVKGTALVQGGDHIRLGGSIFQVSDAPVR